MIDIGALAVIGVLLQSGVSPNAQSVASGQDSREGVNGNGFPHDFLLALRRALGLPEKAGHELGLRVRELYGPALDAVALAALLTCEDQHSMLHGLAGRSVRSYHPPAGEQVRPEAEQDTICAEGQAGEVMPPPAAALCFVPPQIAALCTLVQERASHHPDEQPGETTDPTDEAPAVDGVSACQDVWSAQPLPSGDALKAMDSPEGEGAGPSHPTAPLTFGHDNVFPEIRLRTPASPADVVDGLPRAVKQESVPLSLPSDAAAEEHFTPETRSQQIQPQAPLQPVYPAPTGPSEAPPDGPVEVHQHSGRARAAPPAAHGWTVSPWEPHSSAVPASSGRARAEAEEPASPPEQTADLPDGASIRPGTPDAVSVSGTPHPPVSASEVHAKEVRAADFRQGEPAIEAPPSSTEGSHRGPAHVVHPRPVHPDTPAVGVRHQAAPALPGQATLEQGDPVPARGASPGSGRTEGEHLPGGESEIDEHGDAPGHADPEPAQARRAEHELPGTLLAPLPLRAEGESHARMLTPSSLVMQVLARAHVLTSPVGRVVRFRLEPEQLGELEVRLVLRTHGGLDLHIAATADDVGRALAAAWPDLRDALAARGLHPERLVVTVPNSDGMLAAGGGNSQPSPEHWRRFEQPYALARGPDVRQPVQIEPGPLNSDAPSRQVAGRLDYRV